MRSVDSARAGLLLVALWAGCSDSCACGQGGGPENAAKAPAPTSTAGGRAWPARGADDVRQGVLRNSGGTPAPNPSWEPAPDNDLTRRLRGAKQALETEKVYDQLATQADLGAVLGPKLGKLTAEGDPSSTIREGGESKLAVSARNYSDGDKSVRVKITDTALLPNARRVVSNRLLLVGNDTVGQERGLFVRGYPGVLAHFEDQKVSRATVLVDGRYLIQVMVRDAGGPDEALQIIEQLDWQKLAPKQGKLPAPIAPTEG